MKTLIICGIYAAKGHTVNYYVHIYGQCENTPVMTYIRDLTHTGNHDSLMKECKNIYCNYFEVNDYNIITIDNYFNQWNIDQITPQS
jgi:hypothetical protein